jgi:Trp operon repressor
MTGPQGLVFCDHLTFDNENHLHLFWFCVTLKSKEILTKRVRIFKELTICLNK